MATSVKIKFRPSRKRGKKGSIYYQVIHNRIPRQILTNYKVYNEEWDAAHLAILPKDPERKPETDTINRKTESDIKRLKKIFITLDCHEVPYTTNDIVREFVKQTAELSFFSLMQHRISQLENLGHVRTSGAYKSALRSFRRFRNGEDILADEIDSDTMLSYQAWLKENDISMNTVSFYMRILRAVYNCAVDKKITAQSFPFKQVYTGIDKTIKRAIPVPAMKHIKELDLAGNPGLEFTRDLFMFSFYTRGMSFIDIAYLKKEDLRNGILSYRRKKTGQQLFVKWEKCMQEIVARHPSNTIYMLPIIKNQQENLRTQYTNALSYVNKQLKVIAHKAGLAIPLTMYVARHSWASIARSSNIPVSVISEGMGHGSENTTKIYLASLDHSTIDKANTKIINRL